MSSSILLARDGDIATVTLNRPDKLNAVDLAMWKRLAEVAHELASEDAVRCVIVKGAGKGFGAGADLAEFSTVRGTPEKAQGYGTVMVDALFALRDLPKPTVAQIHGPCTGAGLEIAVMCDIRIAARSARFGVPIQKLGVTMPYPELGAFLELVGRATLLEILLEGRVFDAEEALQKRLVSRVVDDAALDDEVAATARRIADGAPLSHAFHKKATRRLIDGGALTPAEFAEGYASCASEDYRIGVAAFLAKQKPKFVGR
jgi:enoyl-CoA hydratase/carnithine racemase